MQKIVKALRTNEDLESIADTLRGHDYSNDRTDYGPENDLKYGRASTDVRGRTKYFGATSNLGIALENNGITHHPDIRTQSGPPRIEQWTQVPAEPDLLNHLFELYFCWIHPFFRFFSKPEFYSDMSSGRTNYCSALLVNAILANACHLSDRPELRRDRNDPRTAGDAFFEEAKRLLQSEETTLTTVQALAIMGQREPSCGRDSTGYSFSGRAARMAIELGLHIKLQSDGRVPGPTELEVSVSDPCLSCTRHTMVDC